MKHFFLPLSTFLFILSVLLIVFGFKRVNPHLPLSSPIVMPSLFSVPSASVMSSTRETVTVARVVDGDTIELSDGRTLRYIGIDTPETVDPRKPIQCFGREASERNKTLVLGKQVELEKDVSETDRFGRLLRYVYLVENNERRLVNEVLVAEGFAVSSAYPPDISLQERFRQAESQARTEKKGLWGNCGASATPSASIFQ